MLLMLVFFGVKCGCCVNFAGFLVKSVSERCVYGCKMVFLKGFCMLYKNDKPLILTPKTTVTRTTSTRTARTTTKTPMTTATPILTTLLATATTTSTAMLDKISRKRVRRCRLRRE